MQDYKNLEVTFDELYENSEYSNSENFKNLQKRKSDLVYCSNGKVRALQIKTR
jgi:hypothetical protein